MDKPKNSLKGKIARLRKHIKEINGLHVVNKLWVKTYLSQIEYEAYVKKHGWYQKHEYCVCKECGMQHIHPKKFTKWAFFWNLEKILNQDRSSKI